MDGKSKEKIYLASPHMSEEGFEQEYIEEAFVTNWIAPLGANVDGFEKELANKVGIKHAAALSSGTAAILYGSRVKGTFHNGSDIDLALKGQGLALQDLLKIKVELEELNMPYEVDVCILEQVSNQELVKHIERVGLKDC